MIYERVLRPWLFRKDPERAHETVVALAHLAQGVPALPWILRRSFGRFPKGLETRVFGLSFENPIGLAAGFDKDCRLARLVPALGFGFAELGSVTLRPQAGNPKPRIFRLPEEGALINRQGFPGAGAQAAAKRLKAAGRTSAPRGLNIGLNADCPKERAAKEYAQAFRILEPYADYFAVNVSSPNTAGLRDLQERVQLEKILLAVQTENINRKPLLVKISPEVSDEQLPDLLALIQRLAAGVVTANTTLSRDGVPGDLGDVRGGLSGKPLRAASTDLIRKIYRLTGGNLPIIGAGGVFTGGDAFEKIRAGASLVEMYTGLVYRGPFAAAAAARELLALLAAAGFKTVADAVGSEKAPEEEAAAA